MSKWLGKAWPVTICSLACLVAMSAAVGCGDDDDGGAAGSGGSEAAAEGGRGGSAAKPLYAAVFDVSSTEDTTDSYLSVFDSLDVAELDRSKARELAGGHASMQAYNGWVFVGEPSTPIVHRFTVGENGELGDEREVSFAKFGQEEANVDDWYINFISPTKAYVFTYEEGTTIILNPTTLEIEGEIAAPEGYNREGFATDLSAGIVRGERLYRVIFWENTDTTQRSEDQLLLVYDTDTDKLLTTVKETRCRALGNRAFAAEDGTLYFSNWIWPVSDTILYGAPQHCVLRINPDEEAFDAAWSFTYSDIADGRDGGIFTYLKDAKGLVSIFHDEDYPHDAMTDPYELAGSSNWELWNVDLDAKTGSPLSGIPRNGGAYTPVTLSGRSFVMIPSEDFSKTQLYELEGNEAKPSVSIPGWSYKLTQLR